jgi:DNA-binding beta-propeller fold protein YncE
MSRARLSSTRIAAAALSAGLVLALLPAAAWAVGPAAGPAAITTIAMPAQPREEAVDADTDTAYVLCLPSGAPDSVAVISLATGTITGTVTLPAKPLYAIDVDPAADLIYVLGGAPGDQSISVIDGTTDTVTQTIAVPSGVRDDEFALDPSRDLLYVQEVTGVTVIDAATGTVTATITHPGLYGDPFGIAVNPVTDTIYAAYGGLVPDVMVIDGATDTVTDDISDVINAQDIAVNPAANMFYTASGGSVSAYDGATNALIGTAELAGDGTQSIAVNSDTGTVFASADIGPENISLVDGDAKGVMGTLPLFLSFLAVDPATDTLLADNVTTHQVDVIPMQSPAITSGDTATITVGGAAADSSVQLQAMGTPAPTFTETGELPAGGTLSPAGVLGGSITDRDGGVYHLTITASNGVAPAATQAFTLTVDTPAQIESVAQATFKVGARGAFAVQTIGYPAVTVTETGKLPAGVTLSSTGALGGIPKAGTGGVYHFTITASNGVAPALRTGTEPFTLTVHQAPAITSAAKAKFSRGKRGSFTVRTSGYPVATLTRSGSMPSGLVFKAQRNGTATITGTPAKADKGHTYVIVIIARNGVGGAVKQRLSLVVK